MMRHQLFKNKDLQQEFDNQGFVTIPLLSETDINQLLQLYRESYPTLPDGFTSSSYVDDYKFKKDVSDKAQQVIAPRIAEWLKDHQSLGSAFLIKAPGKSSELPMHQDWTIVDEELYDAVNIWTPLVPITPENGVLEILPNSHRNFRVLRAPTMNFVANGSEDLIRPYMKKMMIKPGEAVILNQASVHCSGPNLSDNPRIAITSGATAKSVELKLNYWDSNAKTLETFVMENDFLLKFENFHEAIFQRPVHGTSVGTKPFNYNVLTREQVLARLPAVVQNKGTFKQLWSKLWG